MAATIDEHTQFTDEKGKPLVGGSVFIGIQGADPKTNPKAIFSDRDLQVPMSSEQVLDAEGRTTNKIWISGRYSMKVEDKNELQEYLELDLGSDPITGITTLSNVQGSNAITADASPVITAYVDKQLYTFKTVSLNTGNVTLNINGVGNRAIARSKNVQIISNEFVAAQNIIVSYNSSSDTFDWVNDESKVIQFFEGTAVASAVTTNIWSFVGNTIHVTGTTNCNSFGTAPNVGARRRIIYDGIVTLTNSSNLKLPGNANFTTAAGDILDVYADTLTQFDVIIHRADGKAVTPTVLPPPNGWSFVSAQTAANAAQVDFTEMEAGFDYMVQAYNVTTNATKALSYQYGVTGPTYRTSNYKGVTVATGGFPIPTTVTVLNTGSISMSAGRPVDNDPVTASFEIILNDPAAVALTFSRVEGQFNDATKDLASFGGGRNTAVEAHTAIRILPFSNQVSGRFILYRRPNT